MAIDLSSWNKTITRIAKLLHKGKLKPTDLDNDLLQRTFKELNNAAASGYGADYTNYNEANSKTVQQLQQNIYQFSAAKTYQQLKNFNTLLVDENGKERSFSSFKTLVLEQHKTYNVNYLQAEYQTAKAAAQMARKWQGFQRNRERFPYLKYKTVGDNHVRDEHARLQNFTAHIDNKIWDKIYPPNGWRCRCFIVQTNEASDEPTPDTSFIDPEFSVNVGKTGVIFAPDHPYFVMPKKDENSYKKAFESFKLISPYGKVRFTAKNGAKVFVNPFADANDLFANYKASINIANNLKTNVKIRPHTNIKGVKNYEFELFKRPGDLKTIENYNGILNGFKSARLQGVSVVVFNLTKIEKLLINEVYRKIKGAITPTRNKGIETIILIYKTKAIKITKEAILKDNFKESIKKLKG